MPEIDQAEPVPEIAQPEPMSEIDQAEREWIQRVIDLETGSSIGAGGRYPGPHLHDADSAFWSAVRTLVADTLLVGFAALLWVGGSYLLESLRANFGTATALDAWVFPAWRLLLAGVLSALVVVHLLADVADLRRRNRANAGAARGVPAP